MPDFLTASLLVVSDGPVTYANGIDIPWLRIILALLFCLFLAVGAIGFVRARNGQPVLPEEWAPRLHFREQGATDSSAQRLHIAQRLSMTPTSQIVLLKRGTVTYLLHLTPTSATQIDRFEDEPDIDTRQTTPESSA